jgi:preprotein translocase subunit SecG
VTGLPSRGERASVIISVRAISSGRSSGGGRAIALEVLTEVLTIVTVIVATIFVATTIKTPRLGEVLVIIYQRDYQQLRKAREISNLCKKKIITSIKRQVRIKVSVI